MGLLERDTYLDDLTRCLEAAAAGQGGTVLILGEAGIGKTSLLRQFAQQQKIAKRVLWGGCEALFTPHPLAPLYDIARQIGGEFPAALADASGRDVVFNLTIDELSRGPSPTILIIEDAHWADDATLDLIKFLGRRLQRMGVLLVITYRDDEVNPRHALCSVVGDLPVSGVRRMQLPPLSAAAVAALADAAAPAAQQHHDAARRQAIQRLYEVTGGNPFFVTEALAVAEGEVPPTVRDAVIARMARLNSCARKVVNLASLVPGRIEPWLLQRCAPTYAGVLQDCLNVGMVALPDGALAFRHELARRAAEAQLSAPQQRALHACILEALLDHANGKPPHADISHPDVSLARVVHHADLAGDSDAVLRFAPLAAERAADLRSHREAAAHYATALRHAGFLGAGSRPDERRAELFEARAYECYLTEQIQAAIAARAAALELRRAAGDGLKEGDNLRWLSRLHWFNGNKADSDSYAKQAIARLSALPPGRELAMAYSNCAQLYMLADQAELAQEWGGKAIALASRLNETEILSHAFNNVGTAKMHRMDMSGLADLELSLRLALDNGFEEHAARAYTNLASIAVRHYQLDRARRYLEDGIGYCEMHDLESWGRYMTAFRARLHLERGDWQAATEDAQSIIQHPRAAPISKIPALVVLALVRARRGDPDVDRPLDEARMLALPTAEMQRIGIVATARAEAAWLKGRGEEALEELRATYALASRANRSLGQGRTGGLAAALRRHG